MAADERLPRASLGTDCRRLTELECVHQLAKRQTPQYNKDIEDTLVRAGTGGHTGPHSSRAARPPAGVPPGSMAPRDKPAAQELPAERMASLVSSKPSPHATYTLKEVAQHCTKDDCWLILHGKVYDVTSWHVPARFSWIFRSWPKHTLRARRVPKHPGGPLIYVAAGKDCSQLFDSYHQLYVRRGILRAPAWEPACGSC